MQPHLFTTYTRRAQGRTCTRYFVSKMCLRRLIWLIVMLGVFSWFGVKYFIQRYNIEQSKERLGQKKEELQALVIKNELLVKELQKIKEPEYLRQKALKKGYGHAGEELLKPVD